MLRISNVPGIQSNKMVSKTIAQDLESCDRTEDVFVDENVSFESLSLSRKTLEGLEKCGFKKPSPIQLRAIPLGRCGFDLIIEAKSGTGKTAVFGIVALEMVSETGGFQVLILAPTREIASQIGDVLKGIGSAYNLKVETVMGGTDIKQDIERLKNNDFQVLVGSPGRVLHLMKKKIIPTRSVRLFVLDEADKLMEQSFQKDINSINSQLPTRKQMIAASATYTDELKSFLERYMNLPSHVRPDVSRVLIGVAQHFTLVNSHENSAKQDKIKLDRILKILSKIPFKQCLIFCKYQIKAQSLCESLKNEGWPVEYLAGSQSQSDRLESLKKLQSFSCRILVATDLVSRGIDATNVNLVINMDLPEDVSTYLHRIGRAGRYGAKATAITVVPIKEESVFKNIIHSIGDVSIKSIDSEFQENLSNGSVHKENGISDEKETLKDNASHSTESNFLLSLMKSDESFKVETFENIQNSLDNFTVENCDLEPVKDTFMDNVNLLKYVSSHFPKEKIETTDDIHEQIMETKSTNFVTNLNNLSISDSDSDDYIKNEVKPKTFPNKKSRNFNTNRKSDKKQIETERKINAKHQNRYADEYTSISSASVDCEIQNMRYEHWKRNLAMICTQIEQRVYIETMSSFSKQWGKF